MTQIKKMMLVFLVFGLYGFSQEATLKNRVRGQLEVALLKPASNLNPYYNKGAETESIINLLFDSLYREADNRSGTTPSFAEILSINKLNVEMRVYGPGRAWSYDVKATVTPRDVAFSFWYLNFNRAGNYKHAMNYLQDVHVGEDRDFKLRLSTPGDEKTLRQQLNFKIISSEAVLQHLLFYNNEKNLFVERERSSFVFSKVHPYLRVRDLLYPLEDGKLYETDTQDSAVLKIYLKKDFKTHPYPILRHLTLGEVAWSFVVYTDFLDITIPGIKRIYPFNNGEAAYVHLDPDANWQHGLEQFLTGPVLLREIDNRMANTKKLWGRPPACYKFEVENRYKDTLLLERRFKKAKPSDSSYFGQGEKRDKGEAKKAFTPKHPVDKIMFSRQTGNDIASIKNGFASGSIDMILTPSPGLEKALSAPNIMAYPTKGSHIEMIALNCLETIKKREGGEEKEIVNPLGDSRVRQALNLVLDKDHLQFAHAPDDAELMSGPLASTDVYHSNDDIIPGREERLQRAAELLEQAGYRKGRHNGDPAWIYRETGKPLFLDMMYLRVPEQDDRNLMKTIHGQLKLFGIATSKPKESSYGYTDFLNQLHHRRSWQMALIRIFQSGNTDINIYNPQFPDKNFFNFRPNEQRREEMERLFLDYQRSRDNQRRRLKLELAGMIREEAPAIFLWDFDAHYLINDTTVEILDTNDPHAFDILQYIDHYNLLTHETD